MRLFSLSCLSIQPRTDRLKFAKICQHLCSWLCVGGAGLRQRKRPREDALHAAPCRRCAAASTRPPTFGALWNTLWNTRSAGLAFGTNFRRSVLGCIDSYDSENRRILQLFSRSTRLAYFCSAPNSKFQQNFAFFFKILQNFAKKI